MGAPTACGAAFTVDDLERMPADGRYTAVGRASGTQQWVAQRPVPVTVGPADLVSGLRPEG
ncbi:MAG: hypothetical protein GEU83_09910 [Pseudonocardiaceae bacterium]|nr:hypothetical protein [Pseudonocardiaceae bacterium]